MRPKDISASMETLYHTRIPGWIWGAPRCGKSSVAQQTAARMGLQLCDIRVMQHSSCDFKFPLVKAEQETVKWVQSVFPADPAWCGFVLLEELPNADQLMQSALLELCWDRRIGDYKLPDGASVFVASNRDKDRAGVNRVISSLLGRFVHLDFEPSIEDWHEWAIANNRVRFEVRNFVEHVKPGLFHDFKPELNERSFPSPAAWESVSKICDAIGLRDMQSAADTDQAQLNSLPFYWLVAGCVGQGPAAEFIASLRLMFQLPDRDKILDDPDSVKVPTEPSVLWALCGSLVDGIGRNGKNKTHLSNFVRYVGRMPGEFGAFAMRDAAMLAKRGGDSVLMTKEGAEWIRKNQHIVLAGTQ